MEINGTFRIESCGIASHLASEHLRLTERSGLLDRNRVGRQTFYHIAEPGFRVIFSFIVSRYGKRRKEQ